MNAVGIDVSKGKSTVTIRKPGDVVLMSPCDIPHTQSAINDLIKQIKSLEGETKSAWSIPADTMNRLPHGFLMPVSLSVP